MGQIKVSPCQKREKKKKKPWVQPPPKGPLAPNSINNQQNRGLPSSSKNQ